MRRATRYRHGGLKRTGLWRSGLLLAIAVSLFGSQLAFTQHEYTHLKAPATLRVCQYCVAGTHMQSLPPADVLRLPADVYFERPHFQLRVGVADAAPETVRLRGPPPFDLIV